MDATCPSPKLNPRQKMGQITVAFSHWDIPERTKDWNGSFRELSSNSSAAGRLFLQEMVVSSRAMQRVHIGGAGHRPAVAR
jgi:hypothetical protein